jgi:hypothetical protein
MHRQEGGTNNNAIATIHQVATLKTVAGPFQVERNKAEPGR